MSRKAQKWSSSHSSLEGPQQALFLILSAHVIRSIRASAQVLQEVVGAFFAGDRGGFAVAREALGIARRG